MTMRKSQKYVLSKVLKLCNGQYRALIFSPLDPVYRDKGDDIIRTLFRNNLKEAMKSLRNEVSHCNRSMRPRDG